MSKAPISPVEDAPRQAARVAWEPLTWRGVAAFAYASLGRLLVVQTIFAVFGGATVGWFLQTAWFPTVSQAIGHLPPDGRIRAGVLDWRGETPICLAEGHFLALVVDVKGQGGVRSPAHVQVDFGETGMKIRGLLGDLEVAYPPGWVLALDQAQLQPWWDAWRPAILATAMGAVMAALMAVWTALATVYCLPVWILGFVGDRNLTLLGSWRLSGAALMPGALVLTAAILGYGLSALDLVRLGVAALAHLPIGWFYLVISPLSLPRHTASPPPPANPFAPSGQEAAGDEP